MFTVTYGFRTTDTLAELLHLPPCKWVEIGQTSLLFSSYPPPLVLCFHRYEPKYKQESRAYH
jgi:hypothetical protein